MIKHVVIESICSNGIIDVIALICIPVLRQFFRAKDENGFVAVFIVLDNCESSECFTKTDAISQNAAIVLFQLIDYGQHRITLEIVEHTPDFTLFEARCLVRKYIFGDIFQELFENIIKRKEVNEVRGILFIGSRDALENNISYVLQFLFISPNLIKQLQEIAIVFKGLCLLDRIIGVIASLTAQIDSCKSIERHIGTLIDREKTHHHFLSDVRFECYLLLDPLSTFFGDCLLSQFVA